MILGFTWLDALLVLILVLLVVQGHRRGLWLVLGNLLGFVGGAVIAFFAMPVIATWTVGLPLRWAVLLGAALAFVASGQYVGAALGEAVRLRVGAPALRRVDHALGALVTVVVASLALGLLAFSAGSIGSTAVTREVSRSRVLTAIDALMPDSVLSLAARSRSAVADLDEIPELQLPAPSPAAPSGAPQAAPEQPASPGASGLPAPATPTPGLPASAGSPAGTGPVTAGDDAGDAAATQSDGDAAATPGDGEPTVAPGTGASAGASQASAPGGSTTPAEASSSAASRTPVPTASATPAPTSSAAPTGQALPSAGIADAVVRLTGTAADCAQVQSGSGVAIAPDRVLTNAHVVAGVDAPTVLDRDRGVHEARVVLLDTARDIAVLALDGADLPVARLGAELDPGDDAVAMGFPDGGPFATTPATITAKGEVPLQDVSSSAVSSVDVYTMAADIRHGYSGGPVAAEDGTLAGLVFARAPGDSSTGYALTADTIASAVRRAPSLSATVSSGECTPGG